MAKPSDQVVLIVYNAEAGVGGRNTEPCVRKDGCVNADLQPKLWGAPFHAYPFVHTANKKQYSKSVYIGYIG